MGGGGYKIRNQAAAHFITLATVVPIAIGRIEVFARKDCRNIFLESIKYCQEKKGLLLHAWCIMSNHLHLIVAAKKNSLSDVLRRSKKFTSKQIIRAIEEESMRAEESVYPCEAIQTMVHDLFKKARNVNCRSSASQFRIHYSLPKEF